MDQLLLQIPKAFPNLHYVGLTEDYLHPLSYKIVQDSLHYYKEGAFIDYGSIGMQK